MTENEPKTTERHESGLITPEEAMEMLACSMDDLVRWVRKENQLPEPSSIGDTIEMGWPPEVIRGFAEKNDQSGAGGWHG